MSQLGFTGTLARAAASHPWRTLAAWLAVIAVSVGAAGGLGDVLTEDGELLVETESERADALVADARGGAGPTERGLTEFVIVEATDGATFADEAFGAAVASLAADLRAAEHVVAVAAPTDGTEGLVAPDGGAAMIQVTVDGEGDGEDLIRPMLAVVREADEAAAYRVVTVGDASVSAEFNHLAEETLRRGEAIGLPIALVVLVIVFGAVAAALLPVVTAILSIVVAIGLTVLVGQFTDLSLFIVNMITMIGLAVGIDYSLFIVQRFREERAAGRERIDAVATAGATATKAVLFSGTTVVIALLGLMLMPDTTMRSLGVGAIVVVLAAVAAALTLLPAVLGLLGDRIDRLRLPFTHRDADTSHRFWTRITGVVTARPVVSVVVAGGLLVALAVPYLSIAIGSNFIGSLPQDSDVRHGFEVLNERFRGGLVSTPIVVTADDVTDPAVVAATERLTAALEADPVYGSVSVEPVASDLAIVRAVTVLDPSTTEATEAIGTLRDSTIPAAFDGVDAEALVTGSAAANVDYVEIINSRSVGIIGLVLGLSFVLLTLVFRSLVVPLKAIVMNLLSVGAAYGLLVAVFQWGWGAEWFGFATTDVIESWIPLFLFAVLFGLSMDYHVFLLSRIKERYDRTGDNSASVAFGLSATGAIITGAALIMVAVFAGFAAGDLVMFQQMGFGLAVAVVLDATIVRSVLVPATMELLGDRNWYLPRWLRWLPEIHVEGPAPSSDGLAPAGDAAVEEPVPA